MTTIDELRATRAAAMNEIKSILDNATRALSPAEAARADELEAQVGEIEERLADLAYREDAAARAANVPTINVTHQPEQRTATTPEGQLRGEALRSIESSAFASREAKEAIVGLVEREDVSHEESTVMARWVRATSSDDYSRAFAKWIRDPETGYQDFTPAERDAWSTSKSVARAMSEGTNTSGGYMLPTYLDASIYLTNNGSASPIPDLARVVTVATDKWHGISSAGVTASWDAENAAVSDDSPTIGSVTIPTYKGAAFVAASIEVTEDTTIGAQLGEIFADARDRLEAAAFATGSGSAEPTGIWTALAADTNQQVTSTTAATIGVTDLQSTYRLVPVRFRSKGSWVTNPQWHHSIMNLGTTVSNAYTANLTQLPDKLLTKPIYTDDFAPTTTTTNALDPRVIYGDWSSYVIVRRVGQRVEFIPHLFDQATGRPTGSRGFYSYWRTGAAPMSNKAFALLMDKTG